MSETRVVNTSPLIYLSRADLLIVLQTGADRIVVPRAVVDEIDAWHTADEAQKAVRSLSWFEIVESISVPSAIAAWDLGGGESAVIAFALSHAPVTAVVDDLAARRCAASMNLPLRGTLGLVLRAQRRGVLKSARESLEKLRDAGMYLSDRVLDAALRQIDE